MARKDESIPLLLIRLPWWVSVISGGIVYAGMRWLVPAYWSNQPITAAFGQASAKLAPLAGLFFLVLAGLSALFAFKRRKLVDGQRSLESLRTLHWQDFEWMVAEAYRRQGFSAEESLTRGADGGVDVVLRKDGQMVLVQCKNWKSASVGSPIIRDLYGAMTKAGASRGIVITSGRFTKDAQDFAQGTPIELIDGKQLLALLQEVQRPVGKETRQANTPAVSTIQPTCPQCGAAMVRRTAKRGASAGNEFWGCSTYPKCRGTLSIE